ncbi:Uncharacterised protein [Serratia odorifera]|uniref:Uncharacterized protein n=1 Tax=Serratia odorifera TaxID=618 RepID=A0A3S4DJG6_SEROD|nr:hypothetical protein [Serratia odorifera]VDZ56742.1 Uncharacterised protein [Serratia odorifera]
MTYGFRLNAGGKKPIDITQVTYGSALYFGRPERPDPLNPRLFCPIDWSGFNPNTAKIGIHSGADRFDWGGDVSITADGLWLEQPINYTTDSETPTGLPWCSVIVTALPAATGDAYGLRISNPNGVSPLLIPTRAIQVLSYATVIAGNIGSFDIPRHPDQRHYFCWCNCARADLQLYPWDVPVQPEHAELCGGH